MRTPFASPKPGAARSNRAGCTNLQGKSPDFKRNASNSVPPKDRGIFLFGGIYSMRKRLTEKGLFEKCKHFGRFSNTAFSE